MPGREQPRAVRLEKLEHLLAQAQDLEAGIAEMRYRLAELNSAIQEHLAEKMIRRTEFETP